MLEICFYLMLRDWTGRLCKGRIKRRAKNKGEVGEEEICEPENRSEDLKNKSKSRKVYNFASLTAVITSHL